MKINNKLNPYELLRCPHCGALPYSDSWRVFNLAYGKIECTECGSRILKVSLTVSKALEKAANSWNKRYNLDNLKQIVINEGSIEAVYFDGIKFIREDLSVRKLSERN